MRSSQREHGPDIVGTGNLMQTSLRGMAYKARTKKGHRFQNLFGMLGEQCLTETFGRLNKKSAPGIDRVTIREYGENLEENVRDLVGRVKRGGYRAKPIRRKHIPKANGKLRPLGIPATEDKLLQTAVSEILMAIFEQDFLPNSYGYRPRVGALDAAERLALELCRGRYNYVVEADIKGCFDNIDHGLLMEMLRQRVDDRPFLRLVKKWLKAGVLEEDKSLVKPESGTPQGGSVSPVLANVCLHFAFDLWFQNEVCARMRDRIFFVRYADDFVCLFRDREDAEMFYEWLPRRPAKFGLELAVDKTRIVHFNFAHRDNSFEFLGFEFRWRISRKGRPYMSPRTSPKKMGNALRDFRQWCRDNRHLGTKKIFERMNSKLRGHYNYFGFPGNFDRMARFFHQMMTTLKKWLGRRSQRNRCSWKKFRRLTEKFGVLRPRIRRKPVHEQLSLFSC